MAETTEQTTVKENDEQKQTTTTHKETGTPATEKEETVIEKK